MAGVHVCRVRGAVYAPEFGAVVLSDGAVLQSSVAEALYLTPDLTGLPSVKTTPDGPAMDLKGDEPHFHAAAVFMAWGGRFNYGHFLLDCVPALMALTLAGLPSRFSILSPPLNDWQSRILQLAFGHALRIREISAPLVTVDDCVFASPMHHFLHAPDWPLDEVRSRMLARPLSHRSPMPRIYLSRRKDEKRRMINEAALEAALEMRGFRIIIIDELSIDEQVATFSAASVIVAPTGAALANCLFCNPGTKVFEIQPNNYIGIWARSLCLKLEILWHGFFVASPIDETNVVVGGELKPGTLFRWKVPIEPFLDFLDCRL